MFKRLLKNKKGVTLLEGLIALGLLAMVAGGTFAVLLSASRRTSQPDIREEMIYAIEKANEELQMFTPYPGSEDMPDGYPQGLCGDDATPLKVNDSHNIACRLPSICDRNNSSFSYSVENDQSVNLAGKVLASMRDEALKDGGESVPDEQGVIKITFSITCNGYSL